jgi:hypothetical protein
MFTTIDRGGPGDDVEGLVDRPAFSSAARFTSS